MKEYLNLRRDMLSSQFKEILEQNTQAQNILKETSEALFRIQGSISEIEQLIQKIENDGGEAID